MCKDQAKLTKSLRLTFSMILKMIFKRWSAGLVPHLDWSRSLTAQAQLRSNSKLKFKSLELDSNNTTCFSFDRSPPTQQCLFLRGLNLPLMQQNHSRTILYYNLKIQFSTFKSWIDVNTACSRQSGIRNGITRLSSLLLSCLSRSTIQVRVSPK